MSSDIRENPKQPIRPNVVLSNEVIPGPGVEETQGASGVDDVENAGKEFGSRVPVRKRAPDEPSKKEIEDHNVNHLPYRNWCPFCVSGRGKDLPHKTKDKEERTVPRVVIDYWFLRDHPGAELVPCATMYDEDLKAYKAHVVPMKGNVDGVADMLVKDLGDLGGGGNTELLMKCDQENALNDLVREIKRKRVGPTITEHSKVKDSQSNGAIERAIQSVEGMVRTLKLSLESKIGVTIPANHPIMTWLVEHGAETLNRFHVGADGRTPFERTKGKKFHGASFEFGQVVMHRHAGKVQGGSMEARWSSGVFLGIKPTSDEYMIAMEDGSIVQARSIMAKMKSESWNAQAVLGVVATPGNLRA